MEKTNLGEIHVCDHGTDQCDHGPDQAVAEEELVEYEDPKAREKVSRRTFLQAAVASGMAAALVALDPLPYVRGTAWAESKVNPKYWELAKRYGEPQGKHGKPGDPITLTIGYQPYCLTCQSANITKMGELWKPHFPKGSKVKFGLSGL